MIRGLFDSTVKLLDNALDLRAERHKLLSSNIANVETPGYKAKDINFESELKKSEALVNGNSLPSTLVRTSAAHMPVASGSGPEPAVAERSTDLEGYDQNSVGLESEMVKLSENSLMYATTVKMLRSKFNLLMTAIKEGGR